MKIHLVVAGMLILVAPIAIARWAPWTPKPKPNSQFGLVVKWKEIEYVGNSDKVLRQATSQGPYRWKVEQASSGYKLNLTTGPFNVGGRDLGKPKTKLIEIGSNLGRGQFSPFPTGVVFPSGGVQVGQKWKAGFTALPPVPAGLNATYKYVKDSKVGGSTLAEIQVSVDDSNACVTTVRGKVFVEKESGFVRSGKLSIDLKFMRPNPQKVLTVNSKFRLDYEIFPQ